MNAIQAGYHFAGVLGINPKGQTLNRLWRMANGRIENRRREILELAQIVWSLGSLDYESYLFHGIMKDTGAGGPVLVSPEMQARIDEEAEKLRRENPHLPQFRPNA